MPPRRDVPAQSNGDGRMNGHARQPPRPLASAGSAPPTQPAESKPAASAERPASRFPGFTDYLSGTSQNSFQHLNAPKPSQGSSSPAPGAALVRPAFSPQVPAGSAQRS